MESAVALAGRKGFSLGSLYEVETDFKKVVSDLKLLVGVKRTSC
jgi:hypothetical protein